jgi:hypothetical protein
MENVKMTERTDDLFGEPALLRGEDPEIYWRLYAAVEAYIQPKDFFGRMQVREQTDKIWEELRLKRCAAALVDSARILALISLLSPILKPQLSLMRAIMTPDNEGILPAVKAAYEYYGTDLEAKQKVAAIMARHGITETMVHARAMQNNSDTLQVMDRMVASREMARRNLRKEHERRERVG